MLSKRWGEVNLAQVSTSELAEILIEIEEELRRRSTDFERSGLTRKMAEASNRETKHET